MCFLAEENTENEYPDFDARPSGPVIYPRYPERLQSDCEISTSSKSSLVVSRLISTDACTAGVFEYERLFIMTNPIMEHNAHYTYNKSPLSNTVGSNCQHALTLATHRISISNQKMQYRACCGRFLATLGTTVLF